MREREREMFFFGLVVLLFSCCIYVFSFLSPLWQAVCLYVCVAEIAVEIDEEREREREVSFKISLTPHDVYDHTHICTKNIGHPGAPFIIFPFCVALLV